MTSITAISEVAVEPSRLWALWTLPAEMRAWLPVSSETGPLTEGEAFCWNSLAPFVCPVRTTGRVLRMEPCCALELELDMRLCSTPSRLTVEFSKSGSNGSEIRIHHDGLPDDDLGMFETNGYGHYWLQHLESLTSYAERRPSEHHHRLHVGVYFVGGHPSLGVLVGGVLQGSPVHKAGLQAGDVLQAVDGIPVRSIVEFDDWLDAATPGAIAQFSVLRSDLTVQLPHDH
jgi:hypothetical protein